ncbi:MAG: hypothetical protein CL438_02560 [Acidimicrobiaceae bacterium]|nr:hypothetical protein [Acidimicrobiaceae bacterium]|tara:strand:+ start:577 stop:777 length:201 start_codon:yes stop_codon:yes gene_type:complete
MLLFWSYSRSRSEALCPFIGGLRSYLDPVDYIGNLGLIIEELQKKMRFGRYGKGPPLCGEDPRSGN